MSYQHSYLWASLLVWLLSSTLACSSNRADKNAAPNQLSSDIAALARRVNLAELPEEVLFKIEPMGKGDGMFGPTDYSLIAALRYDPATLARMKEKMTRQNTDARPAWVPERPEWFPKPLSSKIERCKKSWCIEGEEYSGRPFLKSGFVTGTFIVPRDSDFAILLLRT